MSKRVRKPPPRVITAERDPFATPSVVVARAAAHGKRRRKKSPYHRDNPSRTIRLPRDVWAQIAQMAQDRNKSVTAITRDIILAALEWSSE